MTVHELPGAFLRPKDARDTQSQLHPVRAATNFGAVALYLDNVRKLAGDTLRDALEANGFTIPVVRGGAIHGLGGLLPSTYSGAEGVREAYVVSM